MELFRPMNRVVARNKVGFCRTTLLSVGHLIDRKGHDVVIRALPRLENVDLVIVGDGAHAG